MNYEVSFKGNSIDFAHRVQFSGHEDDTSACDGIVCGSGGIFPKFEKNTSHLAFKLTVLTKCLRRV